MELDRRGFLGSVFATLLTKDVIAQAIHQIDETSLIARLKRLERLKLSHFERFRQLIIMPDHTIYGSSLATVNFEGTRLTVKWHDLDIVQSIQALGSLIIDDEGFVLHHPEVNSGNFQNSVYARNGDILRIHNTLEWSYVGESKLQARRVPFYMNVCASRKPLFTI